MYKLNKPNFNRVNKAQYARGTDCKQDIIDYTSNNCYIVTSGHVFIRCFNHLTGKDYTEEFLTFIRTEQRRPNVMTGASIQQFVRKHNTKIGCFDGFRVCPRNIADRDNLKSKKTISV